MPVPRRQLDRTRGRILGRSEQLRVASRVYVHDSAAVLGRRLRRRAILALTDLRLVLVSETLRPSRAELLAEWPATDLDIGVTNRKLGNCLIHIVSGDQAVTFERIDGHRGSDWYTYRFRHGPGTATSAG